jgi:hypothetical protein
MRHPAGADGGEVGLGSIGAHSTSRAPAERRANIRGGFEDPRSLSGGDLCREHLELVERRKQRGEQAPLQLLDRRVVVVFAHAAQKIEARVIDPLLQVRCVLPPISVLMPARTARR